MPPADFVANWSDAPRDGKFYPRSMSIDLATMPDHLPPADAARLSSLGGLLRLVYGRLSRRLSVTANDDVGRMQRYPSARWSRGTASGGPLYPNSMYWVSSGNDGCIAGVYYYSPGTHSLVRLSVGPAAERMGRLLNQEDSSIPTAGYLIVGPKLWRSAFKYGAFSYHVTTLDHGAILASIDRLTGKTLQVSRRSFTFDEESVAHLLGIDPEAEPLLSVTALEYADLRRKHDIDPPCERSAAPGYLTARVHVHDHEWSQRTISFDTVRAMQREMVDSNRPATEAVTSAPARTSEVVLTDAERRRTISALTKRRSAFGRVGWKAIPRSTLEGMLESLAGPPQAQESRVADESTRTPLEWYVAVINVAETPQGFYRWTPHGLQLISAQDPTDFLQRNYFLPNYNMANLAFVLVPCVDYGRAISEQGSVMYRVANAAIGRATQEFYLAAARANLAAGAALGFNNVEYRKVFGLEGHQEDETADPTVRPGMWPVIILMAGSESAELARYRYDLYTKGMVHTWARAL